MAYACDFADGFSDYVAADLLKVWTTGSATIGVSDVDGGTLVHSSGVKKSGLNGTAARIMGMRYKRDGIGGNVTLFTFGNSSAGGQYSLGINSSAQLALMNTLGTAIVTDTTSPLSDDTYYIIEVGLLISGTVGRFEVRINGAQIAALTSTALGGTYTDSWNSSVNGATTIDNIQLDGGIPGEVDWIWTKYDTVVWVPGDFLGNVTKITRRPKTGTSGDGFYNTGTGWSVGAGTTTISDVTRDASGSDGDTSYIVRATAAGTDADRYSVKYDAMPSNTNAVKLVCHRVWTRNTAGSTSTHKRFVYAATGGTTHDSGVTVTDGTTYNSGVASGTTTTGNNFQDCMEAHPNGSAWSKTLVDNIQGGVKLVTLA